MNLSTKVDHFLEHYDLANAHVGNLLRIGGAHLAGCIAACEPCCDPLETVLAAGDDGRAVASYLDCSTSETINWISASGRKTAIFKFESSGGVTGCKGKTFPRAEEVSPAVTWSDPHLIHGSIGIVYSIDQKLDNVDGVRVLYDIGTVLSDVCQASPQ